MDMSDIFARMKAVKLTGPKAKRRAAKLKKVASWESVPADAVAKLTQLAVVLDEVVEECSLDAMAVRCWIEMQQQIGISPCVLLGMLNDAGVSAACEVDVCNAITMRALSLASGKAAACLDWNNNYGDEDDKCILFHCGSMPPSMMTCPGNITDHAILSNAVGPGCGYGCNTGRIAPTPFTYGSLMTEDGDLCFYLGEGRFTDDPIPDDFFGCAGVAEIPDLQSKLQAIGYLGHRHHTSATPGHFAEPVTEAFEKYLGYEVTLM